MLTPKRKVFTRREFFSWVGWALVLMGLIPYGFVYAQFTIEGAGGEARPFVVSIPLIEGDISTQSGTLQSLLREDFLLSGLVSPSHMEATESFTAPNLKAWADKGSDFLVIGRLIRENPGSTQIVANIRTFDVVRGKELEVLKVQFDTRQVAVASHQIADVILERITGVKVGLSQLIAMVVKNGKKYNLRVSDIYGKNSHSILFSTNPIISPSWSPDGKMLAYASFENGPPNVFIQNVGTGERFKIPHNFESTSSPAWSPDGKRIAFTGHIRNKSSIYEYDIEGKSIKPLVQEGEINTEPSYSGDGFLYFSSGRSDSPQIYRMDLFNRKIERVSFNDKNCLRPTAARHQPIVAYLGSNGDVVTILDNKKGVTYNIDIPGYADSVAISPYGRLLLIATERGRNFNIIITNIRGSYQKMVEVGDQSFYEPAWRP